MKIVHASGNLVDFEHEGYTFTVTVKGLVTVAEKGRTVEQFYLDNWDASQDKFAFYKLEEEDSLEIRQAVLHNWIIVRREGVHLVFDVLHGTRSERKKVSETAFDLTSGEVAI